MGSLLDTILGLVASKYFKFKIEKLSESSIFKLCQEKYELFFYWRIPLSLIDNDDVDHDYDDDDDVDILDVLIYFRIPECHASAESHQGQQEQNGPADTGEGAH